MSYCEVADVVARAGKIGLAWDRDTAVGFVEIQRFIDNRCGEIDAAVASQGVPIPVTDATALAALRGLAASGALMDAIRATWPDGGGPGSVAGALSTAEKQWSDGIKGLLDKTAPAIVYLLATQSNVTGGLASDFWSDTPDYGTLTDAVHTDPTQTNPFLAPSVVRTDRF